MTATTTANTNGRVTQVIGSTFDAEFSEDHLPAIYNAVVVDTNVKGVRIKLTGEVQQHLGSGRVRCVALGSTDGMVAAHRSQKRRRSWRPRPRKTPARPRHPPRA